MRLADFSPNVLAIRLFGWALVASLLVFGGCRWQAKLDAGEISEAKAATAKAVENLRTASRALSANAAQFRAITAATDAALKEAEGRRKQAAKAEAEAKQGQQTLRTRLALLQEQAIRDRLVCTVEEARICGSALQ